MERGSLGFKYTDRTNPHSTSTWRGCSSCASWSSRRPRRRCSATPAATTWSKYGSTPEHYAWIGWKNHKHSVNNPYAQFQDEYSLEDIKAAKMIHDPLTKLQCSPTSDGAAAVVVAGERFVDEHDLWPHAIEIAGQAMVTDLSSTFDEHADCIKIVGYDMSRQAAQQAYEQAQLGPEDVQVVELHDCFSANELITYEALGLAEEGEGTSSSTRKQTTYGGELASSTRPAG